MFVCLFVCLFVLFVVWLLLVGGFFLVGGGEIIFTIDAGMHIEHAVPVIRSTAPVRVMGLLSVAGPPEGPLPSTGQSDQATRSLSLK